MTDNLVRFPGFILLDDRKTILKDGKTYPSIKALIEDLPLIDRKRTYRWSYGQRRYGPVCHRTRRLRMSIEISGDWQQGGAA
jgi:hypothetical protein